MKLQDITMTDVKTQGMKMMDRVASMKNARHEIATYFSIIVQTFSW